MKQIYFIYPFSPTSRLPFAVAILRGFFLRVCFGSLNSNIHPWFRESATLLQPLRKSKPRERFF